MKAFLKMGNITGRGLYIILTDRLSIQEYGKTGIIIGKISVKKRYIQNDMPVPNFHAGNIIYEDRVYK